MTARVASTEYSGERRRCRGLVAGAELTFFVGRGLPLEPEAAVELTVLPNTAIGFPEPAPDGIAAESTFVQPGSPESTART